MRVLISVPNEAWIHKLVVQAAINLLHDKRFECRLVMPVARPYEHNLNRIANEFLAQDYQWWLNIDADNPPVGNPLDRIGAPYDVIGFPTPIWRDDIKGVPIYWAAMDAQPDGSYAPHSPCKGLQEVDAVTSGGMLVSRQAVEKVREKFGAPFVRTYHKDGTVEYGPDFLFCRRAKSIGLKVAADYDRPCRHYKEIDLMVAAKRYSDLINKIDV